MVHPSKVPLPTRPVTHVLCGRDIVDVIVTNQSYYRPKKTAANTMDGQGFANINLDGAKGDEAWNSVLLRFSFFKHGGRRRLQPLPPLRAC